jgi:SAM-dependent methyltransferase
MEDGMKTSGEGIHKRFIRRFWASHKDSRVIRREIRSLMDELGGKRGLNLGCGDTTWGLNVVNLDLVRTPAVGVIGDALALPFAAGSFRLVLSQEMVEHVADPFRAVREMARVLGPGGKLYLQAPFIIGYHPGPEDYWRFSRAGMRRLVEQAGLECLSVIRAIGAGTGMYRIAVEFFGGFAAPILPTAYLPAKAALSFLLYPLVWFNGFLDRGSQSDRIPGGYFAVGLKK